MKTNIVDRQTRLLNLILLSAVLLYSYLPILGLETWHRVIPEHDHLFANPNHNDLPDQIVSTPSFDCVTCTSTQPSFNVVHLPNLTGATSLFIFVARCLSAFALVPPSPFVEDAPHFSFYAPQIVFAPLDPPPTSSV